MGAMYRLKAYFGMVPAEDMAEYADEPPVERYAGRRRDYAGDRWGDGDHAAERDLRDAVSPTIVARTATTTTGTAVPPASRAARWWRSGRARWWPGWTANPCGAWWGPGASARRR